jgi:manganese-dependent inorganic pyrophosphatase
MSFSEILVTGHKNPDTDAACSAVCYADFKNKADPANVYQGVVCGALNPQTRFVFEKAGLPFPELVKDVQPRVIDVVRNDGLTLGHNEPILDAIREIDENTVSVIPVFDDARQFLGIIGVHEVTTYFIKTNTGRKKLDYDFHVDNFEKVIPGRFLKKGFPREITAPIMIGSMDFDRTVERMDTMAPQRPVLIVGDRKRMIAHAVARQFSAIIITNVDADPVIDADLKGFEGSIYLSTADTADTLRLLWLSAPVKHIMRTEPLVLQHDDEFDEAKKTLLGSDLRGLAVLKDGEYAGIVTRRSFIEKPRRPIILIDHNEVAQSVPGAQDAEIREIIDHHRLGAEKTNAPIYIYAKPVGSSCTLVFQHYRMHGLSFDKAHAVLMLSGILSDTLFLKSPTTTDDDRAAVAALAAVAEVDPAAYHKEMLATMKTLDTMDPLTVAQGDFKIYREYGIATGIAQVETASLDGIEAAAPRFLSALAQVKAQHNLTWSMLLVTDVVTEDSYLLVTPFGRAEEELAYQKEADGLYRLPGVVSRKKQLLPEILRVMELAGR